MSGNDRIARILGRLILDLWGPRPPTRVEKKQQGRRYCRYAGYGYRWSRGRRVPDPQEASTIGRIVTMRDDNGLSWYAIAAQLLREHVVTRNGREWSPARVRRAYLAKCVRPIQLVSCDLKIHRAVDLSNR